MSAISTSYRLSRYRPAYVAVKTTFGADWIHPKITTTAFNTYGVSLLASEGGYVQTDSANLRMGDIVLYAHIPTQSDANASGHVGVFYGWGTGGHPYGWANNGLPAKPNRPNVDKATGPFDFIAKPGHVTKFFRPVLH